MDFPKGGILGRAVGLWRQISRMRIPVHAANAGYFMILSVFPALVLLLGLLRYTGLQVEALAELLGSLIPEALRGMAEELLVSTYENSSGAMVGLSAVTALWSAGRGIYGLLMGLNAIYDAPEDRGWLQTRLISAGYTFAFLLVLLLTLVLHVFGGAVVNMLGVTKGSFGAFLVEIIDFRFFLLLFLQTGIFTLMFMVLPNKRNGFWESLPGGLLASIGWLVFSDLYSIYVEHFAGLRNIYGSVYAVALSMLWLYCCLSIVFYGGALNVFLQKK